MNDRELFDAPQARSFLAVAQARSFTRAAQRLGLRQSTVSQHVRKLEEAVGRTLLSRDTHSVALTQDGEAMLGFARALLDTQEQAAAFFARTRVHGRVRFGVSDDLAFGQLARVLAAFRREHPLVDVELTVELSGLLHRRLRDRELDLVFAKRHPGETHGQLVRRDSLVWLAEPGLSVDPDEPVPLILYPPPSITRAQALAALRQHGRSWRVACTSASLNGLRAATLAGLGAMVCPRALIPDGLRPAPARLRLPDLGEIEFVLIPGTAHGAAAEAVTSLAETIMRGPDGFGLVAEP